MKKLFLVLSVLLYATPLFAQDVYVNGYFRQDGTYVMPHHRSAPDSNPYNNYSTNGKINPWTGQQGTVNVPPNNTIQPYGNYYNELPRTYDYNRPGNYYGR